MATNGAQIKGGLQYLRFMIIHVAAATVPVCTQCTGVGGQILTGQAGI